MFLGYEKVWVGVSAAATVVFNTIAEKGNDLHQAYVEIPCILMVWGSSRNMKDVESYFLQKWR